MRADVIKLDRALVADVHADPAKIALIGSLVHFAWHTGASICAEGIETLDELRVLIHLGVAAGQEQALAPPGDPWPRVNAEAARLCRELRSESSKLRPLGSRRSAACPPTSDCTRAARGRLRAHGVGARRAGPRGRAEGSLRRDRGAARLWRGRRQHLPARLRRHAHRGSGGSAASIEALVGRSSPADTWYPLLAERFERRGAYFVPGDEFDWESLGADTYVPDIEPSDDPDSWTAEDALFIAAPRLQGRADQGHLGRRARDRPAPER